MLQLEETLPLKTITLIAIVCLLQTSLKKFQQDANENG